MRAMMTLPMLLWVSSMQSLTLDGRRLAISREALSDQANGGAAGSQAVDDHAKVCALVEIDAIDVYHCMMRVSAGLKRQLFLWKQVTGENLHGNSYIFRVRKKLGLDQPRGLQQFTSKHFRTLIVMLESEQGPALWNDAAVVRELAAEAPWVGTDPPALSIRLPEPFIHKLLGDTNGDWSAILLPHLCRQGRAAASLTINWKLLGKVPPSLPSHVSRLPMSAKGAGVLDSSIVDFAIDCLQSYAAALPLPDMDDMEQDGSPNPEYLALQSCVEIFQAFLDGLDPSAFVRSVREMTGKGSGFWKSTRRPYQVAFLVKAVTMASLLRSSAALPEVLVSAASITLPPVLQPAFKHMLARCQQRIPNESTISRWKLLVDGGFMLFQGLKNQQRLGDNSGGFVRYLMADASTQHTRDFEHIMLATIAKNDLSHIYNSACELLDTWCLF